MADGTFAKVDFSAWDAAIANLAGPLRVALARSMGVAGGEVLRDRAKEYASVKDGVLRSAIYLAYRGAFSDDTKVTYSVSWNSRKAPHGHLIEFGHWQPFVTTQLKDGSWVTTHVRLKDPVWIAAHPFLRPALTGSAVEARSAMIARGRERLPQLIAEYAT